MEMHPNRVKQRLASGEVATGVSVQLASPDIVEIIGISGYDFVWIDSEHGSFELETTVHMMRAADAAGTTPIVRVPGQHRREIGRVLDAGAKGVIVPNIDSGAEAHSAVEAAKYQTKSHPKGRRGACPRIRASGHQARDWATFAEWSNANTSVWLLVESIAGVEQIDEILAVDGVDAIMPGPFDLSVSMGYPGQTTHPAVQKKLDYVTEKALKKNIDVVGVLMGMRAEEQALEFEHWVERGCRIINVTSDRRILNGINQTAVLIHAERQRLWQTRNISAAG
jgi:4-hydroxy-2-oxoheptanedioate aldolase